MGELLFWVGEDKMLFGSDYAIWEPKWQVEGFVDWDYPASEEFSDYPRLSAAGKKKILGLNAARLYGLEVPASTSSRPSPSLGHEDADPGDHRAVWGNRAAGKRRRC